MIWKLLGQHISVLQLVGFALANLIGTLIILLALQFYQDLTPAFTSEDGVLGSDYLIVSKSITTMQGISGDTGGFSADEIEDISRQGFCLEAGSFTASNYSVSCSMGLDGMPAFGTEMFFESVPDGFVDSRDERWSWDEQSQVVPIILPRTYLALYNFGFAQSRQLPKMSEGLVSMIDLTLTLSGNGLSERMKGRVVGFSGRLNTILVPESFMTWSNRRYAPGVANEPTRLILKVSNPTDPTIPVYTEGHGYEIQDNKLAASRTTFLLKVVSTVIIMVGGLISLLSFYILMLSVYLLVQKNTYKLQNLLLIGYSTSSVCLPYQMLTVGINAAVMAIALVVLYFVRKYYMQILWQLFPDMPQGSMWLASGLALALFAIVSTLNIVAIRRKIGLIQY